MRIFIAFILGMMFMTGRSAAQEDNVSTATAALQDVLSNLKDSVTKLSGDNDQLAARDNAMKARILQLQEQMGQLENQGDLLNKAAAQLQDKNPRRAQQIAHLEEENYDLDNRIQKTQGGIKLIQESMEVGYQEDQKLLLQLKGMAKVFVSSPAPLSPESQGAAHLQKEKLKLMKMIYDSEQRQESMHEAISDFQKNTPLLPAASALAHQELLKEQIKDLEGQMAGYPSDGLSENKGFAIQWNDTQLRQLELELKALEQNYSQLKNLTELMTKKAQTVRMTVSQHIEEEKLQGNIDDLNRQGEALRADLSDLRSQMVDLDKRKSHLDTMIQH